ncbi:sigma 54-interacting transcriptional regulator [Fredinandcohnia salidurans]|uniref:Sigma 54-interacting transcriptional regulator n=1 Tax=Fredinandcohnia salidurans TaxID=2595041 RepID=A0ABW4MVU2_9BACI
METTKSLLFEVSEYLEEIINNAKSMINLDFSVVDEHLLRIIGTGHYEKYVGLNLPSQTAHDHVVRKGEPLVLVDPLENTVCKTCSVRSICLQEYSVIYPITIEGSVIGAITAAGFDESSKETLLRMKDEIQYYLKTISEFISTKLRDKERERIQESILNTINNGVLLTDHKGLIIKTNDRLKSLGIEKNEWVHKYLPTFLINKIFNDNITAYETECNVEVSGEVYPFHIIVKPVNEKRTNSNFLFVFNEIKESIVEKIDESFYHELDNIVGKSKAITETKKLAINASKGISNVYIQGESGTGKELFARAVHNLSNRVNEPFISVNCAAIPEHLLESELFGYEEGAFTGAKKGGKPGKFELANGGTIFLDEIGDLSLHLQPKLLRVIEYGELERVGSVHMKKLDVRIIAATNRDLETMVTEGTFREDLYYRLNVIHLPIAPLRKRREDIMLLANSFLQKYNRKLGKNIKYFSDDCEKALLIYNWPGNVRELENAVEYAVHMESTNTIQVESLPVKVKNSGVDIINTNSSYRIKDIEQITIQNLIEHHGNDYEGKVRVAKELGISVSTLYRRLKSMGI